MLPTAWKQAERNWDRNKKYEKNTIFSRAFLTPWSKEHARK